MRACARRARGGVHKCELTGRHPPATAPPTAHPPRQQLTWRPKSGRCLPIVPEDAPLPSNLVTSSMPQRAIKAARAGDGQDSVAARGELVRVPHARAADAVRG